MGRHERKVKSRRVRHIVIVSALLLFVGLVGLVVVHISDQMVAVTMSRQVTTPVQAEHNASAASKPPSSAGTPSSFAPGSSVPSSSAPRPPYSSAPGSQAPVSSAVPMDPAVYQAMYPQLYAEHTETVPVKGKVVYLTFDDGPSNLTIPLLDVLDRYQVKATFFLVGKTSPEDLKAMKAIVDRGHAIGVHSYTHRFQQIYATPAAFLDDFARMHDLIQKTTGVDTHIYRFAGGSVNDYNRATTAKAIITEMNRRGYTYFDWNVSSGDAERHPTAASIYNDVIRGVHAHTQSVVLCHNTSVKRNTLLEIPKIIETLQKEGYQFQTLDPSVDPVPYRFQVPKQ